MNHLLAEGGAVSLLLSFRLNVLCIGFRDSSTGWRIRRDRGSSLAYRHDPHRRS